MRKRNLSLYAQADYKNYTSLYCEILSMKFLLSNILALATKALKVQKQNIKNKASLVNPKRLL